MPFTFKCWFTVFCDFFTIFLRLSMLISFSSRCFILLSSSVLIFKFKFSFYDALLCFLFFHLRYRPLFSNYAFLFLIQQILSWFFYLTHLSLNELLFLFFPLGNSLSNFQLKISNLVSRSSAMSS